jgi:CO/xanthine dehydrogenase FAD-binding subunit
MTEGRYRASSVQEALAYLATHRGRAQLVAGGTQLMPLIESGEALAVCLVDISGINALRRIAQEDGHLVMGSAVTLQMMADHPLVHSKAPLLIEAIRKTRASVQPNIATLGGAVATSCGTSEIAVALVTLDTEAQITNLTGSQWLPLSCLLDKSGSSRVDSTSEIVTALRSAPLVEGQGAAMGRVQPADPSDSPSLVLAVMLGLDAARAAIEWISIVTSFVNGAPVHLSAIEKSLKGMTTKDPRVRRTLMELLPEQVVARGISQGAPLDPDNNSLVDLALDCYSRAMHQALVN